MVCSVFDWDRIGRDEYIGSVHVPVAGLRGADPRELSLPVLGEQGQVRARASPAAGPRSKVL